MKITVAELLGKKEALEALVDTKISALAAYKLAKDVRLVNEELQTYETTRNDLIKKLGTPKEGDEASFEVKAGTPEFDKYIEELKPVLETELDLDIQTISISEVQGAIETKYMGALMDFVITE